MARSLALIAVTLLALGGCVVVDDPHDPDPGPGPGDPVSPPRAVTCDQFDHFTEVCTGYCAPTWDCDLAYDSLDYDSQVDLDVCSDCLVDNIAAGICADCEDPEVGITSCQFFMEDLLGIDCW